MIGLFFGTYTLDDRIHQACVLSWSLQQIESTEKFEIKNLRPVSASKIRESGYVSWRANSCISLADQKNATITTDGRKCTSV